MYLNGEFFEKLIFLIQLKPSHYWDPQGIWGSGENGYLFSGSLGALVIFFRDLGSKLIVLGI